MLSYSVIPSHPEAHLFTVTLEIPQPAPDGQLLTLPAWIPGSYMIRDFARHIITISASAGEESVTLTKLDKQTWRCAPSSQPLVVSYDVYAWDLSVRGAHLDTTHGYFNGTCLFLRVVGQEDQPCRVEISPPPGDQYKLWRLATTLKGDGADHLEFGVYRADNYAELIDHPVEMGTFAYADFDVEGTRHEIAITGKHDCDYDRLLRDLKRICQTEINLFDELPSMPRYLFQVMAVGDGYGGLEHRSSTSLICKRSDLPRASDKEVTNGYRQFLGLCSHEYFHLWNVKRITPKVFQDSDLSVEAHSQLLWAFEGITSYYDDLTLARSGCISGESYLELLAQLITRVLRIPGRFKQSIGDSSFDAWTKFYKQAENAPNAIVSYYAKGALIALSLDLTIRQQSGGDKSLDDVMRRLWREFGSQGVGVEEGDVERIAIDETGIDLSAFFDLAIRGTDDLPLQPLLASVGVGMAIRQAASADDKGGVRKSVADGSKPVKPTLGVQHMADGKDVKLTMVLDGGAAQKAGFSAGDVVMAIDGLRVTPDSFVQLVEGMPTDKPVIAHLFRRDELLALEVTAQYPAANTCDLWFVGDVSDDIAAARKQWLKI